MIDPTKKFKFVLTQTRAFTNWPLKLIVVVLLIYSSNAVGSRIQGRRGYKIRAGRNTEKRGPLHIDIYCPAIVGLHCKPKACTLWPAAIA